MGKTSIEWTDKTWNPVVGCTRVSPGCERCYAETMASRHVLMSTAQGRVSPYLPVVDAQRRRWSREVAMLPERLAEPLSWRAGTKVFVVSMGDLFHDGVSFDFIAQVFGVMAAARGVTFQVLTKRPARMLEFFKHTFGLEDTEATVFREAMEHRGVIWDARAPRAGWPKGSRPADYLHRYPQPPDPRTLHKRLPWVWPLPNVWLGTSVEDQQRADERIPLLLEAPALVHFLSAEPLLGPIDLGRWMGDYNCHHCRARFWGPRLDGHDDLVASVGRERDPDFDDADETRELHEFGEDDETRRVCPACQLPDLGTGDVGPAGSEHDDEPRIDWVIPGGESGAGARPMAAAWVRSLRDQCAAGGAAFLFKQWGGVRKGKAGRVLDGRIHDGMPEVRHG